MKKFLKALVAGLSFVTMMAFLAGCVPSNMAKAKEKMEEAGYSVLDYEKSGEEEGLVGGLIAKTGLLGGESLTALLFSSSSEAKEYYEEIKDDVKNAEHQGKWVFWGTEGGVKAFNK